MRPLFHETATAFDGVTETDLERKGACRDPKTERWWWWWMLRSTIRCWWTSTPNRRARTRPSWASTSTASRCRRRRRPTRWNSRAASASTSTSSDLDLDSTVAHQTFFSFTIFYTICFFWFRHQWNLGLPQSEKDSLRATSFNRSVESATKRSIFIRFFFVVSLLFPSPFFCGEFFACLARQEQ